MSDGRRWRVLVVDDELPARLLLRGMVQDTPALAYAGECADGDEAVARIRCDPPDLVLLDVQMPGRTGFDVIAAVGAERMPLVVFVTAYDAYALDAFAAQAFDYLVKPVERERFDATMRRAVRRLANDAAGAVAGHLSALVDRLTLPGPGREPAARLAVRVPGSGPERVVLLAPEEIDRVEAERNYVRVYAAGREYVRREPIGDVEARLPTAVFARLSRSAIVNLARVREIQPWFRGDFVVILHDGTTLTTGRTYRERVRRLVGLG